MSNVVDLGDGVEPGDETEYGTCEMCGQTPIRYVHFVTHPAYGSELEVGCDCAEKMTGDYVNPGRLEKALKRKASSRSKWLSRKWRTSAKGNSFLKAKGLLMTVFPDRWNPGRWKFSIASVDEDGEAGAPEFSKRGYDSIGAAKTGVFNAFWRRSEDEG